MGFDDTKWWDFFDVPVPANPDMTPNGSKNKTISIGDVLAVGFYAFTWDNHTPNINGVDYDSVKDSCDYNADTAPDEEGICYYCSPSAQPNPPWDAGPPNTRIDMGDVLLALVQVGLDCGGLPGPAPAAAGPTPWPWMPFNSRGH